MLMEVLESHRADAVNSLIYEANVRLGDPAYGCMGAISALQLLTELEEGNICDIILRTLSIAVPPPEPLNAVEPPTPPQAPYSLIHIPISLVNLPAILPNLTIRSSEGLDVSHLNHGSNEVRVEFARVAVVSLDKGVGGSATEQLLVRVEEPLFVDEVIVVAVVEQRRGFDVQRCQIGVP
ncbi:hypothetical protein Cgig2_002592 [Carnegiea gigantea]|uniref:LOB domain-containing protein n=1 Tax=Carnegiea gigantea TaxID=171969 RepID=A0A9Q1JMK4_9CARY|nr:hypothetical protein Cgig2_002592 [Carnegiea gigantea]